MELGLVVILDETDCLSFVVGIKVIFLLLNAAHLHVKSGCSLEDFHLLFPGPWTKLIQEQQTKTKKQTKNSSIICRLTIDNATSGECFYANFGLSL